MPAHTPEKIRTIIAELEKSLAQIRRWREMQGATAPDRSPHQIDDELLDACLLLVDGMQRVVGESASGEIPESLANLMNFAEIGAQVRHAQFRAASAVVAQINGDASGIKRKAGSSVLQSRFSEYGKFFALLHDAVPMAELAQHSSEARPKLLVWATENLECLISFHKQLLACESAAVREKWRQMVRTGAAVIAALATVAAAVWGVLAG